MQIVFAYIAVMHWYISTYIFVVNILFGILSGAWNMKDRRLYQGATVKSWGLLVYGWQFSGGKIDYFKTSLKCAA